MRNLLSLIATMSILMFWSSCRDDFEFRPSSGNLEFSRDTVYLDTIFTNIGSSTYNLKVYNYSGDDIIIPSVRLGRGQESNYRLNVDGMAGKEFSDVELLARDSLFIFIETTIDINETVSTSNQFLYTDVIQFDSGGNQQNVELVTLVKDAKFIFPQRFEDSETGELIKETLKFDVDGDGLEDETVIEGRFLTNDELNFTSEKPYVIYGYAGVGNGQTLTIDAGARIHFHANSGLIITDGGSLNVNGRYSENREMLENEVVFEGDRLEQDFSEVPGQWGTIWLFNGSQGNTFNYATIKNAAIGILSEGGQNEENYKLNLRNTQIYNSSNFGVLGRATSIKAENLVINNSGQSSFAGIVGGRYNFTHSTIANYWSNSFRQFPSILLNNYFIDENETRVTNDLTEATFNNCIIYGNDNPEFILDQEFGSEFNFKFNSCLLRFEDPNNVYDSSNYDFSDSAHYENNLFNREPVFLDPFGNELIISDESAANMLGLIDFAARVPFDILNVNRALAPDAGAYQSIVFEEE